MSRMSDLEVLILQTNKYEYCKYFCSLWNYVISSSLFTVINGTEFVFSACVQASLSIVYWTVPSCNCRKWHCTNERHCGESLTNSSG